uniref:hypothetical protein n=1 Tax=Sodalis glossinidius TaxID=63612 RepID=UPI0015E839DC|nr:hypothetical protein [Sodalis glossinidius]
MEAWNASGRSVVKMGRWRDGKLMKELGISSCQLPTHKYKRGGNKHVEIPNHLNHQFAVTGSGLVWRCDLHLDGQMLGLPAVVLVSANLKSDPLLYSYHIIRGTNKVMRPLCEIDHCTNIQPHS